MTSRDDGRLLVVVPQRTPDVYGTLEAPGADVVASKRGFDGTTGKVERLSTS